MKHDQLAAHLAAHLRGTTDRMVWEDIMTGQSGSPRPDVLALKRSYRIDAVAYECKVSRADFLSDVGKGKWTRYLEVARSVWFAVPEGLVARAEVPGHAGLMVLRDGSWKAVKRPKPQPQPDLPADFWMKLLLDGIERECDARLRYDHPASTYRALMARNKAIGKDAAKIISDRDNAISAAATATEAARERIERIRLRTDAEIRDITERLHDQVQQEAARFGLEGSTVYELLDAVRQIARRADMDRRVQEAERKVETVRRSVHTALRTIDPDRYR